MKQKVLAAVLGALIVFVFSFQATRLSTVHGAGPGYQLGQAVARLGARAETVVMVVNGEPITLAAIEVTKTAVMISFEGISEEEAYREAMRGQLRQQIMQQKAREQGITVNPEEVEALLEEILQNPEQRQFLEDQLRARGKSTDLWKNPEIRQFLKRILTSAKLGMRHREQGMSPQDVEKLMTSWLRQASIELRVENLPPAARSITLAELIEPLDFPTPPGTPEISQ